MSQQEVKEILGKPDSTGATYWKYRPSRRARDGYYMIFFGNDGRVVAKQFVDTSF